MARSLPKVCPFLVTVDLKLKWPELPRGPNYPALPYPNHVGSTRTVAASTRTMSASTRTVSAVPEPCRLYPNRVGQYPNHVGQYPNLLLPTWFGYWPTRFGYSRQGSGTADMVRVLAPTWFGYCRHGSVLADMVRVPATRFGYWPTCIAGVLADMHRVSGVGRPLRVSPIGAATIEHCLPNNRVRRSGPPYTPVLDFPA